MLLNDLPTQFDIPQLLKQNLSKKNMQQNLTLSKYENEDSSYYPKFEKSQKLSKKKDKFKNFRKNIVVAILDFLIFIGYQYQMKELNFTREDIQSRNSASIQEIFQILQFLKKYSIDRIYCQVCSSNILLQNSKVLNKRFNLQIIAFIFTLSEKIQLAELKYKISKYCQSLKQYLYERRKIFEYQSTTIYLLSIFIDIFEAHTFSIPKDIKQSKRLYQNNQFQQQQKTKDLQHNLNPKPKNCRQILKPLEKKLKNIINEKTLNISDFQIIDQSVKQQIFKTTQNIKETLKIRSKIPNINQFNNLVVKKCFQIRKDGKKLTAKKLKELIDNFLKESLIDCSKYSQKEQKQSEIQIQYQQRQEVINTQKIIPNWNYLIEPIYIDNFSTRQKIFSPTVVVSSEWKSEWNK